MATISRAQRFDALYQTAEAQSGFFTAAQALAAGYSPRLVTHHAEQHHFERWGRGIYRLVHFPQLSDAEDLIVHWLWSERSGVFSHETALQLHQLSDALPSRVYMTLPPSWAKRRLRVPEVLRLSYGDVDDREIVQLKGVPVTTPARTVNDSARSYVQPELVQQAVHEGLERKLFAEREIGPALAYMHEQCG